MKNIADILASCLEDIKAGKVTAEECLARHEDLRGELEPLLRLALNVGELPRIAPSASFNARAKASLMEEIRREQAGQGSKSMGLSWLAVMRSGWVRVTAVVLAVVIVLSGVGAGTVFAANDSLPGETLYPVKIGWEEVRDWLETDITMSAVLQMEFAGRRLDEIDRLFGTDPERISLAISRYKDNLRKAVRRGNLVTLMSVAEGMTNHMDRIDSMEDIAEDTEPIGQVRETAIKFQIMALQPIAIFDVAAAANLTIVAMEQRMQRAEASFAGGKGNHGEQALHQFLQISLLCDDITAAAGEDAELNALLETASKKLQGQFDSIKGNVPVQLAEQVENAFQHMRRNQHGRPDTSGMEKQEHSNGNSQLEQNGEHGGQGGYGQDGNGQHQGGQPTETQTSTAVPTQTPGASSGQTTPGVPNGGTTGTSGAGPGGPSQGQQNPSQGDGVPNGSNGGNQSSGHNGDAGHH